MWIEYVIHTEQCLFFGNMGRENSMVKKLSRNLLITALIIGMALYLSLNTLIQNKLKSMASDMLGVTVMLEYLAISPFSGEIKLGGLVVGNPKGFVSANLFTLDEIYIRVQPSSVFSDVIKVKEVRITAPQLTYETNEAGVNVQVVIDHVMQQKPQNGTTQSDADASGVKKKFMINNFYFNSGKVNLATPLPMMPDKKEIILPEVHLTNIGSDNQGATALQIGQLLLEEIKTKLNFTGEAMREIVGSLAKGVVTLPFKLPGKILSVPGKILPLDKILPFGKKEEKQDAPEGEGEL